MVGLLTKHIPLTDITRVLLDMHGFGLVRTLREAASLTSAETVALAVRLVAYGSTTDKSRRRKAGERYVICKARNDVVFEIRSVE